MLRRLLSDTLHADSDVTFQSTNMTQDFEAFEQVDDAIVMTLGVPTWALLSLIGSLIAICFAMLIFMAFQRSKARRAALQNEHNLNVLNTSYATGSYMSHSPHTTVTTVADSPRSTSNDHVEKGREETLKDLNDFLEHEHIPGEIWKLWLEAQHEIHSGKQPVISNQYGFILEKVKDPNAQLLVVDSFKIQTFLDQRTSSRHRSQATADFSDHSDHSEDAERIEIEENQEIVPTHLMANPKNMLKPQRVSTHSSPQSSSDTMRDTSGNDEQSQQTQKEKHDTYQSEAFGVLIKQTDEEMTAQLDEYRDIITILRECDPEEFEVYLYNFQRERITDQILKVTQCDPYNDAELIWKQVLPHTGVRFAFKTLWNQRMETGWSSS